MTDAASPAARPFELGLYSFGELGPDTDPHQRLRELVEEIVLVDQVGLDVFGVGEHHRPDFVVSSPAVVLAAAAARKTRTWLSSAVNMGLTPACATHARSRDVATRGVGRTSKDRG